MNLEYQDELSLLPVGRQIGEGWDRGMTLHLTPVYFQGRWWCYYVGREHSLNYGGDNKLGFFWLDVESYNNETGQTQRPFLGRNVTKQGPIIDLDTLREDVRSSGDIAGFVSPVTGKVVLLVQGRRRDAHSVVMILTSSDGSNFEYEGIVTRDGGEERQGNITPVWVANGKVYALNPHNRPGRGNAKGIRVSDDGGFTFTSIGGPVTELADNPEAYDHYTHVTGRAWSDGTYSYLMCGGSYWHIDWPEAVSLWRCRNDRLDAGDAWEEYPRNPLILRGPMMGGIWQVTPVQVQGELYAIANTWGALPHPAAVINSEDMNTLRETVYHKGNEFSFKAISVLKASNTRALNGDWDYDPIGGGNQFRIAWGDRYLAVRYGDARYWTNRQPIDGAEIELIADPDDPRCHWRIDRGLAKFHLLRPVLNTGLALKPDSPNDSRALGMTMRLRNDDGASGLNLHKHHWHISLREAGDRIYGALINRYSSLALQHDLRQQYHLADFVKSYWTFEPVG